MTHGSAPGFNPLSVILLVVIPAVIALVRYIQKRWEKP